MPANRFFVDIVKIANGDVVDIKGEEFVHAVAIMRKKSGDSIEIINGRNLLAKGVINKVGKNFCSVMIENTLTANVRKKFTCILLQAITRRPSIENSIEKATALGIDDIWLLHSENCDPRSIKEYKRERTQKKIIAAMKQCGRLDFPTIRFCDSIFSINRQPTSAILYGDIQGKWFPTIANDICNCRTLTFVVGPEQGFSPPEIEHLQTMATPIKLNTYTLKSELASIVGASMITSLRDNSQK